MSDFPTPPENALCRGCGYALRGLPSNRCPECGREFDPRDPATMLLGRRVGRLETFFSRPPRLWLNGPAALAGVSLIVATSGPGGYFGLLILTIYLGMFLAVVWGLRLLIAAGIAIANRRRSRPSMRTMARWVALPVIFASAALICAFNVPELTAFWLSKSAMERHARVCLNNPTTAPATPSWLGVFPIKRVETFHGGVRFFVAETGFLSEHGYEYLPQDNSAAEKTHQGEKIAENWYRWTRGFMD
ncbi:MAG: hypothetical protein HZB38_00690 [Planctomycetes bacterium]|nr:hypothetical protein [Planctomycetota bacterium]